MDGTKLRILLNDTIVIIINNTGHWKKMVTPDYDFIWFNDDDQVVMWQKYNSDKRLVELFFNDGHSEVEALRPGGGAGPSGLYFVRRNMDRKYIYPISNPTETFAELPIGADYNIPVYYYNNKIYCFATDRKRNRNQVTTLHIFNTENDTATLISSIDIKHRFSQT